MFGKDSRHEKKKMAEETESPSFLTLSELPHDFLQRSPSARTIYNISRTASQSLQIRSSNNLNLREQASQSLLPSATEQTGNVLSTTEQSLQSLTIQSNDVLYARKQASQSLNIQSGSVQFTTDESRQSPPVQSCKEPLTSNDIPHISEEALQSRTIQSYTTQPCNPQPCDQDNTTTKADIQLSSSCIECVKAIPVRDRDDIKVGDHLINSGILYDHHAIVIEILPDESDINNKKKAKVRLIHSTNSIFGAFAGLFKIFGGKSKVMQTCEYFDFEMCRILVVKYLQSRFEPSEIVHRAQKAEKAERENDRQRFRYHVFSNNCEHFATYCVINERFSVQINTLIIFLRMFFPQWLSGPLNEKLQNTLAHERGMICDRCFQRNMKLLTAKKKPVKKLSDVGKGDIITFPYWNFYHDAVVMEVHIEDQKEHAAFDLTIAHYAFCGPFKHHTVLKERKSFCLDGSVTVTMFQRPKYTVYGPDETVERAESRIGEQQFTFFANDSNHFARWCKLPLIHAESTIQSENEEDPGQTMHDQKERRTVNKIKCLTVIFLIWKIYATI